MTHDELMVQPEPYRERARWDLSSRWRCACCGEIIYLEEAAIVGNYCCGGCGMTTLRPYRYELPAVHR